MLRFGKTTAFVAIAGLVFAGGCQKKEAGPLERAGAKVDRALEKAADKTEEVIDEAADAVEEATEDDGGCAAAPSSLEARIGTPRRPRG